MLIVGAGDGACHSHQCWGCKEKKNTYSVSLHRYAGPEGPIVFDHSQGGAGVVVDVGDGGRASCIVAADDTGSRADIRIHGAEGKSVSSICTMGVLTCHAIIVIVIDGAAKGRKNCPPVPPSFCGSRDLETFKVL